MDLSKFASIGQYLESMGGRQKNGEEHHSRVKLVQIGPRFKLKFINYKESYGEDGGGREVQLENTEMGGDEE